MHLVATLRTLAQGGRAVLVSCMWQFCVCQLLCWWAPPVVCLCPSAPLPAGLSYWCADSIRCLGWACLWPWSLPSVWLLLDLGSCSLQTTIHQPSSRLYQMLDRLLLLSEGHVFFYGR